MKIYISGPVTNEPRYMEIFNDTERMLKQHGFDVINPVKVNAELPESTSYAEYLKMSLTMLDMCDAIYMMDGWERSNGAQIEYKYARSCDKKAYFQTHGANLLEQIFYGDREWTI